MLLFGPTLVLAWLVGCKSAKSLALGLAVSIEAAQTAFGYGFDWVDVFDLFCDGLGIALAIWLYQKISRRFESRRS
jgi:glycopeptide antibiotics resistance protein